MQTWAQPKELSSIMNFHHINDIAIRQILQDNEVEADVWFVGIADDGQIFTQPWWECEMHPADLPAHAIRLAVRWNEKLGVGAIQVKYFDLRQLEILNEIVKLHEQVDEAA